MRFFLLLALFAGFICQGTLLAQGPIDCPVSASGASSAQVPANGSINSFLVITTKAGCAYSIQVGAIGANADLSAIHLTNAASGVTQAGLPVLIDYQIDANATPAARHFSLTFVITGTNRLQFNIDQDAAGTPTFYIHCPILYGPTTVGVPYYNYCNHVGGTYPYTGSVTSSPPAGVTAYLDGTDFDITGTPTAPGPYNFTINMSDSVGHTASQTFSGTVVSPPVVSCNPSTGPPW